MRTDRPIYYRIDGHDAVPSDSRTAWESRFEATSRGEPDPWRVALDDLSDGRQLSTVFLCIDHQFGDGPPLLFETMLFGDGDEEGVEQWRWSTWDEAAAGHAAIVAELTGGE